MNLQQNIEDAIAEHKKVVDDLPEDIKQYVYGVKQEIDNYLAQVKHVDFLVLPLVWYGFMQRSMIEQAIAEGTM